ncbi:hypothetical protein [Catenuloplanes atrovinosus]|uniref:Uncharacterized protein n=1 Tax=Catenuloplanes atrovinosus TaxID=137266 RepID=A0AAE4CEE1_9ACTN|nr:hypothetical protein [Catenuloplanes atrovinosus]MDR7281023.1 hypothetical protein [Catenuloplanes atrovinosus]
MSERTVDVSMEAALATDESGHRPALVTLATRDWQLNIRATLEDLARLADIRAADRLSHRSLAVGTTAGAPVHWAASNGQASLLVGADDEAWDIAVLIPLSTVEELAQLARQEILEHED